MAETTLAFDIGGSRLKAARLEGTRIAARAEAPTPHPAEPEPVLAALAALARELGPCDRVGAGFPGVVERGTTQGAVNLGRGWEGFALAAALEERFGRPVRVANDADVQGLGAVEGRGKELLLTLGTGVGSALFFDGLLIPNLELGHLPSGRGGSFEERLGQAALEQVGARAWRARLLEDLATLLHCFGPDRCHLGGGNARLLAGVPGFALPPRCRTVPNDAGLTGCAFLFGGAEGRYRAPRR